MYYFEIPQQVTNENAITLVYYLAQQKTVNTYLHHSHLHKYLCGTHTHCGQKQFQEPDIH